MKRLALTIILTSLWAVALTGCDGNLTDRDGNTYKTVKIGSQIWMAENLKVRTEDSWCYKDKESNCQKYGRLYNWDAAKSACPAGWHLPHMEEFKALFAAVGGKEVAGKKLKSTNGWEEYEGKSGNVDDAFGFSALPAGGRGRNGGYDDEGNGAYFWSSTEYTSNHAYGMHVGYSSDKAGLNGNYKGLGFSVRCVKH